MVLEYEHVMMTDQTDIFKNIAITKPENQNNSQCGGKDPGRKYPVGTREVTLHCKGS